MMNAIRVHEYANPSAITLDNVDLPDYADDEILVRVHAASINPVDWKVCDGILREKLVLHLPFVPGGDFSGTVAAVGAGVAGVQPGDDVFGMTSTPGYRAGAFAEYVTVKAKDVALKPRRIGHIEAASVPLAALTAWQAVFSRGELRRGQRVLIHAGAGGVGSFALQFAHEAGAYVVTTTSAKNIDHVRALGADEVIDYNSTKFEDATANIDLVIDLLGDDVQAKSYAVLRRGGILVNAWGAIMADKAVSAGVRGVKVAVEANGDQLAEIATLIDAGKVKTTLARKFPLSEAIAAMALSKTGHVRGKIVLTMMENDRSD